MGKLLIWLWQNEENNLGVLRDLNGVILGMHGLFLTCCCDLLFSVILKMTVSGSWKVTYFAGGTRKQTVIAGWIVVEIDGKIPLKLTEFHVFKLALPEYSFKI